MEEFFAQEVTGGTGVNGLTSVGSAFVTKLSSLFCVAKRK